MKQNRHVSYKISDIKALRSLTKLLGKLEIPSLYHKYLDIGYLAYCAKVNCEVLEDLRYIHYFGYGLAESKAFVEQWFNYTKELSPTEVPCQPWPWPKLY